MHDLKNVSIFEKLSSEELQQLSGIAVLRAFPEDATVFWQDDESDALYVIVSGCVKVYCATEDGRERILQVLGPRDILGEISLLDGHPRSATVQTLEPTRMLVIQRRAFEQQAMENPRLLWKIQQVICEKLRVLSSDVVDISYRDVRYRLLRLLLHLAARHGQSAGQGSEIRMKLTHRDLANLMGSNRETVTRLMTRLTEDGLLRSRRGSVVLEDVDALERELAET